GGLLAPQPRACEDAAMRAARTVVSAWLLALHCVLVGPAAAAEPDLQLVQTIALANVKGRLDHLAIDLEQRRLFVAALGNNSVEVVSLAAGLVVQHLERVKEPQGVLYVAPQHQLFVTSGREGALDIFDGQSLKKVQRVQFSDDADNLRLEAAE